MALSRRRTVTLVLLAVLVAVVGWTYVQHLVPAIHPDHDHGLENLAGGGFLRVERAEGGTRNLVGRPGRVLILHWFEPGAPTSSNELPALVDYAARVARDPDIEVALIALGRPRAEVLAWAREVGVPVARLHVDRDAKTAGLIGVRRTPETLVYDPEGRLAHQARGPMNWRDPRVHAAIEEFKHGVGEHEH